MNAEHDRLTDEATAPLESGHVATPPQVVALTCDSALQEVLQELAAGSTHLSTVSTIGALSEELIHVRAAVALVDAAAVTSPIEAFVAGLAAQFPDLVLIVAGGSADQAALARQIASSQVYRFLHKPASPQRTQIFLDSALRHQQQAHSLVRPASGAPGDGAQHSGSVQTASGPPWRSMPQRTRLVLIGVVFLAAAGGLTAWLALRSPSGSSDARQAAANASADAPAAAARAQQAREAAAARQAEQARTLEDLLIRAESALTDARLDEAEQLTGAAQALAPDNARLKFIVAQLGRERERAGTEEARRTAAGARASRLQGLLSSARRDIGTGALLEPARENARAQLEAALALAPDAPEVLQMRGLLVDALLAQASQQLDGRQVEAARRLLDAAGGLGVSTDDEAQLARLRRKADDLHLAQQAQSAAAPAPPLASSATDVASPTAGVPAPLAAGEAARAAKPAEATRYVDANTLTRVRGSDVDYPPEALRSGISGWIEVEYTVAVDGSVRDIVVLDAQPRGYFEARTLATLKRWRYAPVQRDGAAVESRARLRLRFVEPK